MNDKQMNDSHYPYVRTLSPVHIDVSKGESSLPVLSFSYNNYQADESQSSFPSFSPHLIYENYQNEKICTPNYDSLQKNLPCYSHVENPISNDEFSMEMVNSHIPSCYPDLVINKEGIMGLNSIPDYQNYTAKELPVLLNSDYSNISNESIEEDMTKYINCKSYSTNAAVKSPLLNNYFPIDISRNNEPIVIDMTKCTICKKNVALEDNSFSTNDSVKYIVSYIKSILGEIYGSHFGKQINSIEYEFQDRFHLNRFLELFSKHAKNKDVLKNKIIHKKICPVPRNYAIRSIEDKGIDIVTRIVQEKTLSKSKKYDETTEALNKQKISYFFPKLMTKIAVYSKFDRAVEKTLKSKKSLFILGCKARLAWKFNNIDASALFKLSAVEIERGNLNQAFIYYKHAGISLSNMIFRDKLFSFLSEGKTKLTSIKELRYSGAKYFLYRQVNIALMNDNSIFSFTFNINDCMKLNNIEVDGAEAIKSIDYFSMEDLENVAARFNSNSDIEQIVMTPIGNADCE